MTSTKNLLIIVFVILIVHSIISITFDIRKLGEQLDIVLISVITGVISGFVANSIFRQFEKKARLKVIKERLKIYEGIYDVNNWRDLITLDKCGYQVKVTLDELNGILNIHQTGKEEVHELFGYVKINELTFNYGEGNYTHPQKKGNPTGRMQIFLVGNGLINVDKYYLDDKTFQLSFEKWQWKKKSGMH